MTVTLKIEKNVYGGDGLGRLGDGRVVFVPGAWAGEQVKAEIVEERKHFVKARLVEVVEKSPDRVECAAERVVPGMVYANLSCEGELKAKESQLKEFFERARIEVPEFVSAKGGSEFNYRNKVVYHFARYGNVWRIGYRTEPTHEIVDVADDPLARPEIDAKLYPIYYTTFPIVFHSPYTYTNVKWTLDATGLDYVTKEGAKFRFELIDMVKDVDMDGAYTIGDATALQRALAEFDELTDNQRLAADVNGDKTVNVVDVTELQRYLAKQ